MVRTQIQFTETQLQALRARSQRDQLSVSELVRRAVDAWTQTEPAISPAERCRRAAEIAGQFASGRQDVAEHHDVHLAELFRQ